MPTRFPKKSVGNTKNSIIIINQAGINMFNLLTCSYCNPLATL